MQEERKTTADSMYSGINPQSQINTTGASSPVGSYGLPQNSYDINSLEVHQPGSASTLEATPEYAVNRKLKSSLAFSRHKAMLVSACITILITLLTGATILLMARHSPTQIVVQKSVSPQDVSLKDASLTQLPADLQTKSESLLVNGDIITRGQLKISNGSFATTLRIQDTQSNQTFTLPNTSGVFCLDSNNCNYATQTQLKSLQQSLPIQGGTGVQSISSGSANLIITKNGTNVTVTDTAANDPKVTSLNSQSGSLLLQGTPNRITVNATGGTFTLSTPQDINTGASPTFAGLVLSGLNCTTFSNGGKLTTDANGNLNCANDTGGAGSAISGGGTSGTIPIYTSAQVIADSIITQTGATVNVNGSLNLSNALGVGSGGTGLDGSAAANGQLLIGNGTGYSLATITQGGGITITNAAGSITAAVDATVCRTSNNCSATGAAGGDLIGTYPNPTIAKLQGTTLNVSGPTAGSVLIYNATNNRWENHIVSSDVTISETGVATIATNAVTTSKIADASVTNAKLQNSALTVTAGTGLTGGGSTALGASTTLNLANTAVTTGTYGNASNVSQFTVDQQGRITGATNVPITGLNSCSTCVSLQATTPGAAQTGNINVTGTVIAGFFSGDGSGLTNLNGTNIASGTVANARLVNAGALTVTAGTGLTGGGSTALGASTTLNLANTAVTANSYGNASNVATFTVDAQGRLTAAGNVPIAGLGSCASCLAKNTNDTSSSSFLGSLYGFTNTNAGAAGVLSLTSGGTNSALSVSQSGNPTANQALIFANNTNAAPSGNLLDLQALSVSKFSVTAGGAVTATGTLRLSSLNCTTFGNGGKLTTDASGNVSCASDTGGAGSAISGTGTPGQLAKFTGSQVIGDSILSESGTTVTVGGTLAATALQGDGSGLTGLNASNLASGTVANTRLTAAVTLQGNTFNGASQLVQLNGSTQLPAVSGALVTNLNGANITAGTVANTALANSALTVTAGTGLTGGGSTALGASTTLNLANTAVTTGTYGNASNVSQFTVDQQGRITGATNVPITGLNSCSTCVSLQATTPGAAQTGNINVTGTVIAGFFSGDGSGLTNLNGTNIASGTVANARLVNAGALTVTAGTGLTGGGSTALGASTTLNLANTAVTANSYGNASNVATFTVDAQGRLTAAGNVPIAGLGSCASCLAKNTNDTSSSSFLGSLYGFTNTNAGAAGVLSLTSGGTNSALSVSQSGNPTANQALIFANNTNAAPSGNLLDLQALSVSKFSVTAGGAVTATGTLRLSSLNCTTFGNGGKLTTDASGNVSCASDTGGAGSAISGTGTPGQLAKFTGSQVIGDSILSESGTTVTVGGTLAATALQGDGSGLTGLNASNLASGTVANTRLTAAVTLQGNTFNGASQLVQLNGSTQLPAVSGALVTNLNGANITAGTVANTALANSALTVTAGTGLTGGGSTALGASTTLNLANTAVTTGTYGNASNVSQFTVDQQGRITGATNVPITGLNSCSTCVSLQATTPGAAQTGNINVTGTVIAGFFSGDGSGLTNLNGTNIASGTVANARLVNAGALTVTAGTGLTGGGSTALGASTTLNLANTAVTANSYGNASNVATFTVDAQGRLTAAGNVPIAGLGSCASCLAKNTNDTSSSSFLGSLYGFTNTNAGAAGVLSLTSGGTNSALSVSQSGNPTANQALIFANNTNAAPSGNLLDLQALSVSKFSVTAGGAVTATGTLRLSSLNCTTFGNGGKLTTDASGNVSCASDTGGAGSAISGTGTPGQLAKFTGSQVIGDSILSESGTTVTVGGTLAATALQGDGSGLTNLDAGNITVGTLAVARGGTGASSFTADGIIFGNGSSNLGVTAAGMSGQCLLGNTGAAPSFGTCTGSGGVSSLNGLTGTLTLANATTSLGTTITVNDATTVGKGIASFNNAYFSTSSGAVSLANTAVTTGTYGNASNVSQFTVDQQGRITGATNVPITGLNSCSTCVSLQATTPGAAQTGNINVTGTVIAGFFSGDGSGLTGLNASNLASGTVANTRLTAAVTLQGNTFNGASQLVQLNGSTQLPAVSGALVTNLNGANITAGTVANTALANSALTVTAGTGLTGGGSTALGASTTLNLANTAVTTGTYGNASNVSQFTVDQQGRITGATNVPITGLNSCSTCVSLQATTPGAAQTGNINVTGTVIAGFFSGDGSGLTNLNGTNIASGTVANARLVNAGALTVTAGTGLTGGGSTALGASTTLNLANTAVTANSYGNASNVATFTVDAQGRLTAAGNVPIAGLGSCASCLAKNTNDTSSSSFLGSLYGFTNTNAGAAGVLSLTSGGTNSALSVSQSGNPTANQALIFANNTNAAPSGNLLDLQALSVSKFSVTAGGAVTATGTLRLSSLNCTTFGNGGKLTTDASGNVSCASDTGGAGSAISGTGTPGQLAKFTGSQVIGDSILSESGTTVTVGGTLAATALQGDGSGLTGLNASNLASGTVANTRLTAAVTLQGNTFNGASQLVQLNGSTQLPAVSGALVTNLNGANITAGTVANTALANSALTVTAGTGLTGGGSTALGASTTLNLANTAVTTGTYGNASNVSQFTVDQQGRITGATNVPITGLNSCSTCVSLQATTPGAAQTGNINVTGTVIAGFFSGDGSGLTNLNGTNIASGTVANARLVNAGALTVTAGTGLTGGGSTALGASTTLNLANTAVTANSYGNASNVATFTVDAQGRLTAAGNVPIAGLGSCASCLAKNTNDTSSSSFLGSLYGFTNTNAGAAGVLSLTSGGTNSALSVSQSGNPTANQALIFANNTNAAPSGNLLDLQALSVSKFSVTAGGAVTATSFAGAHTGNGSGLTSLNGANITAGTVANTALANSALTVTAGTGLTGGGSTALGASTTLNLANTAVTTGTYGNASNVSQFTVDQQGRITGATNVPITGLNSCSTCVSLQATTPGAAQTGNINVTGTVIAGFFSGDGSGLTNLNGTNIASGTVANARLVNAGALTVTAGTGLTGGGSTALGASTTLNLANTAVTTGTYGNASNVSQFTVDQQGRITGATNVPITGLNSCSTCVSLQATTPGAAQTGNINVTGTVIAGFFSGDGSGLTNLNGTNIASGTVANARLVNAGALTVTAGTGLTGGGSTALGASTTLNLANTAVTTGTYGNASNVSQFTVDQQGRITGATNVPITGLNSCSTCVSLQATTPGAAQTGNINVTGTVIAGFFSGDGSGLTNLNGTNIASGTVANARLVNAGALTVTAGTGLTGGGSTALGASTTLNLANTAVTTGTYGNASNVSQFTVDQQGRITGATNVPITGLNSCSTCVSLQATTPGAAQTGNINVTGTVIAGFFSGDGSGLTGLNASNLASGTVANTRLTAAVTLQGNTFNGASQLVQLNGSTQLPAVSGALVTNLNGANITAGTVANTALANSALTVTAGTGLTGGGSTALGASTTLNLANTAVTTGTYGNASNVSQFTVDQQGRITGATNVPITGLNSCSTCVSLQATTPGAAQTGNINVTGTVIAGFFSGDGSGLTGLNASNLASGTVANTRLTAAVTLQGNTFNGASQLVQLNGSTQLPAVSGALVTNLNGSNITSGTVAVAQGGTGIGSYTKGDLLYASGPTTLSNLADVSSGSCLVSGGVGFAPNWGACAAGGGSTLQTAYNSSPGGTTPEIIVNTGSNATGVDIQNNNGSPITGSLFAVRDKAASGLGTGLLTVSNTGVTNHQGTQNSAATRIAVTLSSCSGTGWSGAGTYTHSAGTTPLTCTLTGAPLAGSTYEIDFTTGGMAAADSISTAIGSASAQTTTSSTAQVEVFTATSVNAPAFTPNTGFTGTISSISVWQIGTTVGVITVQNSSNGSMGLEVRAGGDNLNNSFIGVGTGQADTTGIQNSALGQDALLSNTSGGSNTAMGQTALFLNTTGGGNTAVGQAALQANTTASNNTAVGQSTLLVNTTGSGNVALGQATLQNNTTASNNTGIGQSALFSNTIGSGNIALGQAALNKNIDGNNNTALGQSALFNNTSGLNNVAVGQGTLLSNTTGSKLTVIGQSADVTVNGLQNATAIGYGAQVGASDSLVLGGTGANAVKVGIGTATPSAAFDVNNGTASIFNVNTISNSTSVGGFFQVNQAADASVAAEFVLTDPNQLNNGNVINLDHKTSTVNGVTAINLEALNSSNAMVQYANIGVQIRTNTTGSQNGDIFFGPVRNGSPTEAMRITAGGFVGIGGIIPTHQLQLSTNDAAKPTSGTWTIVSDRRLKRDITSFTDGLSVLGQINPVNYTLNGLGGTPDGAKGIGVIAQDVKDIIPYTIGTFQAKLSPTDTAATTLYSFDASALTFVTINAVKELGSKAALQDEQIQALSAQVNGGSFQNINVSGQATVQNLTVTGSATIANLTVTGSATIDNLTVNNAVVSTTLTVNGHIISGGTTAPTIATGAAVGTSAGVPAITPGGNDTAGVLTISTGTAPTADGVMATITFATPYGSVPKAIQLTPQDSSAAGSQAFVTAVGSSSFGISFHAPTPGKTYSFSYLVVQ